MPLNQSRTTVSLTVFTLRHGTASVWCYKTHLAIIIHLSRRFASIIKLTVNTVGAYGIISNLYTNAEYSNSISVNGQGSELTLVVPGHSTLKFNAIIRRVRNLNTARCWTSLCTTILEVQASQIDYSVHTRALLSNQTVRYCMQEDSSWQRTLPARECIPGCVYAIDPPASDVTAIHKYYFHS